MPRLELILKLIPPRPCNPSSSSSPPECPACPLEVVIFRVHVIVDSLRDFIRACRKSREVEREVSFNVRVVNYQQQAGSGVFLFPPIIVDPHVVNNQDLHVGRHHRNHVTHHKDHPVVNNQDLRVVNNQDHPVVNNQDLPVVNNQDHPVVNNQDLPVVNNQDLVVNNQDLVVNNQDLVVNNQDLPVVNNQDLHVGSHRNHDTHNKDLPVVNNQDLPVVNNQDLPVVNNQPPIEEEPFLVSDVRSCLHNRDSVHLCKEGVGGTYLVVNNQQEPIAIFKPVDEEPGSPNNPKKFLERPLLPPGGGACREVAAYLLDQNRAGVPETHLVDGLHHERFSYSDRIFPKTGSLQKFVPNIGNSLSMSSSRFTVEDVHNIGILDLRLLNLDRNGENLLIRKEGDGYRLVPIDHAYTLPDKLDNVWVEWLHWRQAKVPFGPAVREFVAALDPEADARILSGIGISPECIRNMKISTCLLKKGVSAGLTLFEIASMVCRKKQSEESELEKAVARAWNDFPTEFERNGFSKEFEWRLEEIVCEVVEKRKNLGK